MFSTFLVSLVMSGFKNPPASNTLKPCEPFLIQFAMPIRVILVHLMFGWSCWCDFTGIVSDNIRRCHL